MSLTLELIFFALAGAAPTGAYGQLELITNGEAQGVFAGDARSISVTLRNPGGQDFAGKIRVQLLQASSATVVQRGEIPWKQLRVLPGQTVLESAQLDFPTVKAETRFLVRWLDNTNVIGKTEVLAYPTNLLAELKRLLGEDTLGVLDPNNELKPLLQQNGVAFVDLGQGSLEDFSGRLAVLGPFRSRAQLPEDAAKRSKAMAKNGVAVVWLQPPPSPREPLRPSYYSVAVGTNAIVVVQSGVVAGLAENPQAQQRLLQLCRQALHPEAAALPETNNQP